jgi:putative DNA primase/helicase
MQVVSKTLLESIAVPVESPKPTTTTGNSRVTGDRAWTPEKLEAWMTEHHIEVYRKTAYNGGYLYELRQCPWNDSHINGDAHITIDGQGKLGAGCHHDSCQGKGWTDLRPIFEPDAYAPKQQWQDYRPGTPAPSNGNGHVYQHHAEPGKDETKFVLECLDQDEAGDAQLFAHLFRGKVIHDTTSGEWYHFKKHRWELDTCGAIKLLVSGKLASTYLQAAATVNLKAKKIDDDDGDEAAKLKATIKALTGRALALRKASRINNVLSLVIPQDEMHITSDKWDCQVWLLPVANGVIDLRTGRLSEGKPEDYVRTASPTKWEGLDAPAPKWEQTLEKIFSYKKVNDDIVPMPEHERDELIGFLQRTFGYGVTGLVSEEIFLVLFGEEGRNGKDTIIGGIKRALGPTAGVVSKDVFLSTGRFHSAGSATPHLCDLQGKRIAWADEPDSGARFNAAQVKDLTGGSPISTRQNYGKQYSFDPTFLLLLLTNHKPHADATDEAFWSRLRLVTFNMRFVDNPDPNKPYECKPDKTLKHALEAEASGILAWLVRGCLAWQQQGLNAPESVLSDGKEYQKDEDNIAHFLEQCCLVKTGLTARAEPLYKRYARWCDESNLGKLSSTKFGKRIGKLFSKKKDLKGAFYEGVGILSPDPDGPEKPMTGSNTYDGLLATRQDPVSPPLEPDDDNTYDGYDGKTSKVPTYSDDFFKNQNFSSKAVIPVIEDSRKPPVEPYDGLYDGSATRHITRHSSEDPEMETLVRRVGLKFRQAGLSKVFWRPANPNGYASIDTYLKRLREMLQSEDPDEQAEAQAEVERRLTTK